MRRVALIPALALGLALPASASITGGGLQAAIEIVRSKGYDSRYLGTDAARASAQIEEVWRDDRTIALLYILYRNDDPLCCPTGGGKIVRFHWNGKRLGALDRIPTDDFRAPLHR